MNEFFSNVVAVKNYVSSLAGGVTRSLWLIAWFFLCFALIFFTMAAQQFQLRMNGATDATKYTVGYMLGQVDALAEHDAYKAATYTRLRNAEALQDAAFARADEANEIVGQRKADLVNAFERAINGHKELDGEWDEFLKLPHDVQGHMKAEEISHHLVDALQPNERSLVAQAESAFDNAAQHLIQAAYRAKQAWLITDRVNREYQHAMTSSADSDLQKQDLVQLASDLESYRGLLCGIPFKFVSWPSIILTLLLTLLMGILGSLIALTREVVFENIDHSLGQYLFRIGLGASVALAVFLFAGAGMITLAQPSGGVSGTVELSPYLVSFLGIVSGYLSRRVTLWMRESGAKIFPVREEADRWAIDLQTEIQNAGSDAAKMAEATLLSTDDINKWISRKAAIPYFAQGLIAAFLRRPAYKLFSDIAPPP